MGVINPKTSNEYSYTFLLNGTYGYVQHKKCPHCTKGFIPRCSICSINVLDLTSLSKQFYNQIWFVTLSLVQKREVFLILSVAFCSRITIVNFYSHTYKFKLILMNTIFYLKIYWIYWWPEHIMKIYKENKTFWSK